MSSQLAEDIKLKFLLDNEDEYLYDRRKENKTS